MTFERDGFLVSQAFDGQTGLQKIKAEKPDLVILDLMLPKMPGLEVCKEVKRIPETSGISVIILTAKAEEIDRIVGLELGADDYVAKPFSPRELVLRAKSVLKRFSDKALKTVDIYELGPMHIDCARHEVKVSNKLVNLTATEFRLLHALIEQKGKVLKRDELLRDVWHYDQTMDTRTVDTHIRRLRDKMGIAAKYIETIRGVGYRMLEKA
jgi:two-component system phosphate regulon response regulator PhoB